jgi:hypothetical protein
MRPLSSNASQGVGQGQRSPFERGMLMPGHRARGVLVRKNVKATTRHNHVCFLQQREMK